MADLSKLSEAQRRVINNIAQNDGGRDSTKIDTQRGFDRLMQALGGDSFKNLTPEQEAVINGLKVEIRNNITNNSYNVGNGNSGNGNQVGHGDRTNNGGAISYGSGSATVDNSININGGNVTINIGGSDNETDIPEETPPVGDTPGENPPAGRNNRRIFPMDFRDYKEGRELARQMHDETNSNFAMNSEVIDALSQVDKHNAYAFFERYYELARGDRNSDTTGVMHDAHDLHFLWTDVENKHTFPAVEALLTQVENAGFSNCPEYARVAGMLEALQNSDDIDAATGAQMDAAIKNLLRAVKYYVIE